MQYQASAEELRLREIEYVLSESRSPHCRVVLYHATTLENLLSIIQSGLLRPPSETGRRVWRNFGESEADGQLQKLQKIYLAPRKQVLRIAEMFRETWGGSVFIVQATVDMENLRPDEDTSASNWLESLGYDFSNPLSRGKGRSCAHQGPITNFSLFGRIKCDLSREEKSAFIARTITEGKHVIEEYRSKVAAREQREQEQLNSLWKILPLLD